MTDTALSGDQPAGPEVNLDTLRGLVRMSALTVMDEVGGPVEHRSALATAIAAKASLGLRDHIEALLKDIRPAPADPAVAAKDQMVKAYAAKVSREYAEMDVSMGDMASAIWDLLELLNRHDPNQPDD